MMKEGRWERLDELARQFQSTLQKNDDTFVWWADPVLYRLGGFIVIVARKPLYSPQATYSHHIYAADIIDVRLAAEGVIARARRQMGRCDYNHAT